MAKLKIKLARPKIKIKGINPKGRMNKMRRSFLAEGKRKLGMKCKQKS